MGAEQLSAPHPPAGPHEGGSWEPPTCVWCLSRLHWGSQHSEPKYTVEPMFRRAQLSHPTSLDLKLLQEDLPLSSKQERLRLDRL